MKFKKIRKKILYTAIWISLHLMISVSQVFPRRLWLAACGALGKLSYFIASDSRGKAIAHLTLAFGREKSADEIRSLAKRVFVMLGRNGGDILRSFRIRDYEQFKKLRVVNNFGIFEKAFERGRGVIILVSHVGAFEFTGTEISFRGYNPLIIGAALKDGRLNRMLVNYRSKVGGVAIERGKETFRLLKHLKLGGIVGLLIDQDTKVKSVFVNFFGRPCATPVGAATLALKTGAAVVPMFSHMRKDGMHELTFHPEIELIRTGSEEEDTRLNTQTFTDVIEQDIRRYPEQWVWMHERWKTKPGQEIK